MNQNPMSMPTRSLAMSVSSGARQSSTDGSQNRSDATDGLAPTHTSATASHVALRNTWTRDMRPPWTFAGSSRVEESQTECRVKPRKREQKWNASAEEGQGYSIFAPPDDSSSEMPHGLPAAAPTKS